MGLICSWWAGAPGRKGAEGDGLGGVLGAAGMILRDPSTFHLIVQQVIPNIASSITSHTSNVRRMTPLYWINVYHPALRFSSIDECAITA